MSAISSFSSISGVEFQPRPDDRSRLLRIVHVIQSLFREIKYSLTVLYYRLFSPVPQLSSKKFEWNPKSQGLFVLVHGLRNDPAAWYSQLSLLSSHREIDVFAPVITKRGLCSLDQATNPLLPVLNDYVKKHPTNPICLLGTSNGGRIITKLEIELRHISPSNPVRVSSVAGAHYGSSRMNLLNQLGLAKWFYRNELRQELRYSSDKAKELLTHIKSPLKPNCAQRSYEFYATTEDISIPDLDSTLPNLGIGEQCHMLHGVGHSSIVSAVAERQISSCLEWTKNFSKN